MKKVYFTLLLFFFLIFYCSDNVFASCYKICKNKKCDIYDKSPYANKDCWEFGENLYEFGTIDGSNHCVDPDNNKNCKIVSSLYCINALGETIDLVEDSKCSSAVSVNNYGKVSCGNIGTINKKIPELTSWFITIVEVAVPIILIIMGIIDFVKSLSSQKEDEIKRGQQVFIKRIITSVMIFFVIVIVKLLINFLSGSSSESGNMIDCIECFINNNCN